MRAVDLFAGAGRAGDCWTGIGRPMRNGYRVVRDQGKPMLAHRLSFIAHKGPIPDGLVIDHLCRNRACCNPDHLEAVTNAENILRGESPPAKNARKNLCPSCGGTYKTRSDGTRMCQPCRQANRTEAKNPGIGRPADRAHCPKGHPYDAVNTYLVMRTDGSVKQRMCKECGRQRVRERRQREAGNAGN